MSRRTLPLLLLLFVCLAAVVGYVLYPSGDQTRPDQRGPTDVAGESAEVEELGEAAELVAAEAAGAEVVRAPAWEEGMGASLRAGLGHLLTEEPPPTCVLVTLVDLPDVGEQVHRRVLAAATSAEVLARAAYDGRPGHPVLIGHEHWAEVLQGAVGDRGARAHLGSRTVRLVECGDLASGRDVDTSADLDTR